MSSTSRGAAGRLLAVSDLHVAFPENRRILELLRPGSDADWLVVAGDVAELVEDVEWALAQLSNRFATVIWVPGNHELWTPRHDAIQLRGEFRYHHLVELCRRLGVQSPEDPYLVWNGEGGPVTIAPLFVLYDYTFRPESIRTKDDALAWAHAAGVVCSDEWLLHTDPYPSADAWCRARVEATEVRLAECDPEMPTVLVNHFPLIREPTRALFYQEFAMWCGTERTSQWHKRFRAASVVYGHLHIPRSKWHDGVLFQEVSLGYPREWRRRGLNGSVLHQVLPPVPVSV